VATEPGVKNDDGKTRLFTVLVEYFPRALLAVANVSEFGARKYCVRGWETVPDARTRYTDALLRHILAGVSEESDVDSGLHHDAHAAWNALARLELRLREERT